MCPKGFTLGTVLSNIFMNDLDKKYKDIAGKFCVKKTKFRRTATINWRGGIGLFGRVGRFGACIPEQPNITAFTVLMTKTR